MICSLICEGDGRRVVVVLNGQIVSALMDWPFFNWKIYQQFVLFVHKKEYLRISKYSKRWSDRQADE